MEQLLGLVIAGSLSLLLIPVAKRLERLREGRASGSHLPPNKPLSSAALASEFLRHKHGESISRKEGSGTGLGLAIAQRLLREISAEEFHQQRLLLVESEHEIRGVLREALSRAGYDVFEAGSLSKITALLGREQLAADIVLLDVPTPQLEASKLLETLNSLREPPPVLRLNPTAHGFLEPVESSRHARFAAAELRRHLRTALSALIHEGHERTSG